MKQKEIKKPENYTKESVGNIKKMFVKNILQLTFVVCLIVWIVSSVFVTIGDIFNEFNNKWSSISFILLISIAGYLSTAHYIIRKRLGIKKPKSACNKCGKTTVKK